MTPTTDSHGLGSGSDWASGAAVGASGAPGADGIPSGSANGISGVVNSGN